MWLLLLIVSSMERIYWMQRFAHHFDSTPLSKKQCNCSIYCWVSRGVFSCVLQVPRSSPLLLTWLLSCWTLDIHNDYLQNWSNDIKIVQSTAELFLITFAFNFSTIKSCQLTLKMHIWSNCVGRHTIPIIIYNSYGTFSFAALTQHSQYTHNCLKNSHIKGLWLS